MTILWGILSLISLAVILVIITRHFAALRMLNVETLPQAREKKLRATILAGRLSRIGQAQLARVKKATAPALRVGEQLRKRFEGRVHELEMAYLAAKRKTLGTRGRRTAQIVGLLREAEELVTQEKFEEAERKYLSVIALDPRNVDAYEGLGNLYLDTKRSPEAREALTFILKFRPNDASVLTSMGEVALAEEKFSEAVGYLKRAVDLRPGNPKYLDFLIETALRAKDKSAAEHGLKLIKEANPENNKISEWEQKIKEL